MTNQKTITRSPYTPHEPKGDPEYWHDERDPFHQFCSVCNRTTVHKLGQIHRTAHGENKSYVCQEHNPDMENTITHGWGGHNIFAGNKRGGRD